MQKIDHRGSFAQELGVGDYIELLFIHSVPMQHTPNPVVGVDRNSALLHNHLIVFNGARNLGYDGLDIRKVRGAAIALRGANGDEYRLAPLHGLSQVSGEHYPAAAVLRQQLGQMFLKDGHTALAELLHPGFVVVDTDDLVTHVGKTSSGHQPNVSGADHAN